MASHCIVKTKLLHGSIIYKFCICSMLKLNMSLMIKFNCPSVNHIWCNCHLLLSIWFFAVVHLQLQPPSLWDYFELSSCFRIYIYIYYNLQPVRRTLIGLFIGRAGMSQVLSWKKTKTIWAPLSPITMTEIQMFQRLQMHRRSKH